MSMLRQLWLAIIVSTLVAVVGTLLVSVLSARNYLQSQLALKNTDNAAALALSLSQGAPDATTLELAASAQFDAGHYELIRITSPEGNPIVELKENRGATNVPAWFMRMVPLDAPPGIAQISDGWKQAGIITLVSESRFAYETLWHSVLQLLGALTFAGALGGGLGTLVLRRLKPPLASVIWQAREISQRRFSIISEPNVPELQQLARAMNSAVNSIQAMFEEEAKRLNTLREQANNDPLTGVANRRHFMSRLTEFLQGDEASGATVLVTRIADLESINHQSGRHATDELLCLCARNLNELSREFSGSVAARLNGAEFALLVPDLSDPTDLAPRLLNALQQTTASTLPMPPRFWMAAGHFEPGSTCSAALTRIDIALASAQLDGPNTLRFIDENGNGAQPLSLTAWGPAIRSAIENREYRLGSFPVCGPDGRLLHREAPLRLRTDAGEWLPAGRFLPIAERLQLTPLLDLAAVDLALDQLGADPASPGIAANLSASSLRQPGFPEQLLQRLKHRAESSRLWLEFPEQGVLAHLDAVRVLFARLKALGCTLGIEHCGRQFGEFGRIYDLGLDYLKVDASFVQDLESHPGNQAFLRGLVSLAHGIKLRVFAEGVQTDSERDAVFQAGFDGATGPGIRET